MSYHQQGEEETWDKEEYIEVEDEKRKQAILKAEEEKKAKEHEQNIYKIIDEKPQNPIQKQSQPSKPQFIQDDRERVYPTQVEAKKITNQNQEREKKEEKTEKREDKTEKRKEKTDKKEEEDKSDNREKKDRKQQFVQKDEGADKKDTLDIEKSKKRVYQEKKYQKYSHEPSRQGTKSKHIQSKEQSKLRKQIQVIRGEEIQLELWDKDIDYPNEIYVGKRDVEIYFDKAKELLQQYDFIVLKSFAIFVSKTFTVAGLIAKEFPELKQINIPSTVEVKTISAEGEKHHTRGAVRIELSLSSHQLNKDHIGYQQAKTQQKIKKEKKGEYVQKQDNPKYVSKEQPRYVQKESNKSYFEKGEKRSSYADKPPKRTSYNLRKEQTYSSEDERQLR